MEKFNNLTIRKLAVTSFLALIFLTAPPSVFADSEYVLPYPSYMPGNFLYTPRLILSRLSQFVYFGDFGRFKYNLKEADHSLVEAKTLFEYKQYLLASFALKKSDYHFQSIYPSLIQAKKNKKDVSEKEKILKSATAKHMEVLEGLKLKLPEEFIWTPERGAATKINLSKMIGESIRIRGEIK